MGGGARVRSWSGGYYHGLNKITMPANGFYSKESR